MAYVVKQNCIKCKYTDCVEVCPVDCFYEGDNMLVINPDECIDCGVCEPECPTDAILPILPQNSHKDYMISIRNGHKNGQLSQTSKIPVPMQTH